ncbi:hypothetical protein DM01DRAFT_1036135 [Hesseltinella vesiculosa]|uniref:Uncharacterized protein n=1 Tax=Hesseltinella vesiculosa TaxID=101127 RepID=A0A1X2GIF9_9FUNG|nr:hypothetical protein DM01DRAFT_1036135 [Hesseltinella vesiculosa]
MNGIEPSRPAGGSDLLDEELDRLQLMDELDADKLDERRRLFFMLLQTYLAIEDKDLMVARALHLLNTQGYYFDALKVLDIIPDDWPLDQLQDFLVHSLRRSLHNTLEGELVVAMSRGENLLVGYCPRSFLCS